MSRKLSGFFIFQVILSLTAVSAVLIPVLLLDNPWPVFSRDHLEFFGKAESGARNMVSAIYLGYRVFDTLGETIVLLVVVSGTIGIIASGGAALTRGFGIVDSISTSENTKIPNSEFQINRPRNLKNQRTALIEVVTGKLGPVVLVFGFYVMLYGHLSPGGGFQGGVVIASGIVFLALGGRLDAELPQLTEAGVLMRLETTGFMLLVLASLVGMISGGGFFANPLGRLGIPDVGFIIALNAIIGLKVGAGIGFMCIAMLGRAED